MQRRRTGKPGSTAESAPGEDVGRGLRAYRDSLRPRREQDDHQKKPVCQQIRLALRYLGGRGYAGDDRLRLHGGGESPCRRRVQSLPLDAETDHALSERKRGGSGGGKGLHRRGRGGSCRHEICLQDRPRCIWQRREIQHSSGVRGRGRRS